MFVNMFAMKFHPSPAWRFRNLTWNKRKQKINKNLAHFEARKIFCLGKHMKAKNKLRADWRKILLQELISPEFNSSLQPVRGLIYISPKTNTKKQHAASFYFIRFRNALLISPKGEILNGMKNIHTKHTQIHIIKRS